MSTETSKVQVSPVVFESVPDTKGNYSLDLSVLKTLTGLGGETGADFISGIRRNLKGCTHPRDVFRSYAAPI